MPASDYESIPCLGAGIGLRKEHFQELKKTSLPVGWLEIIPENFMNFGGFPRTALDFFAGRWPVVSHGVNLSIGSVDPLNGEYLEKLKDLLDRTGARWFSDHLCFTSVGGRYLHDLLPLPFSHEAADHVVRRVKEVKKKIGRPFLLENPTYYVRMPGAKMSEAAFFNKVLEDADCGMLLDVNNVYVNSRNHAFDPKEFIRALPLRRVAQIHLAGHEDAGDVLIDTHEGPVPEPVWDLYLFTLEAIGRPVSTLLEWDTRIPSLDKVVAEALRAQEALRAMGLVEASALPRAASRPEEGDAELLSPARSPLSERREAGAAA